MSMTEQDLKQLDQELIDLATEDITTIDQLYEIQTKGAPANVYLPFSHNIYDINLDTRVINGPKMLSVQRDHKSEVIYFKIDRYFDYMDLNNTICIIQYIVPGDKEKIPHIYIVPFFDTVREEGKLIFPWVVGGSATAQSGTLEYAIRFYRIVDGVDNEPPKLVYNLNTLAATTQILVGLEADTEIMKIAYDTPLAPVVDDLIAQFQKNRVYWTII